jgi:hypothetical protein
MRLPVHVEHLIAQHDGLAAVAPLDKARVALTRQLPVLPSPAGKWFEVQGFWCRVLGAGFFVQGFIAGTRRGLVRQFQIEAAGTAMGRRAHLC